MNNTLIDVYRKNNLLENLNEDYFPRETPLVPIAYTDSKNHIKVLTSEIAYDIHYCTPEQWEMVKEEALVSITNRLFNEMWKYAKNKLINETIVNAGHYNNRGDIVYGVYLENLFLVLLNDNISFSPIEKTEKYWKSSIQISYNFFAGPYTVFAIKGINKKNPLTDKIAKQLINKVPFPIRNGFTWFMNRSSYASYQKSELGFQQMAGFPIVISETKSVEGV